jgi:hypothetical protein
VSLIILTRLCVPASGVSPANAVLCSKRHTIQLLPTPQRTRLGVTAMHTIPGRASSAQHSRHGRSRRASPNTPGVVPATHPPAWTAGPRCRSQQYTLFRKAMPQQCPPQQPPKSNKTSRATLCTMCTQRVLRAGYSNNADSPLPLAWRPAGVQAQGDLVSNVHETCSSLALHEPEPGRAQRTAKMSSGLLELPQP